MKSMAAIFSYLSAAIRRRDVRLLLRLLGAFVAMVTIYSITFHALMDREDQSHSWPTSVYWTLTTMTTLGFGDITFKSDAGRVFSVVVLLSGTAFLLVLLPFTFIQFVFVPWMSSREAGRAPRRLPETMRGHLVLTRLGPIEDALVRRAQQAQVPYVVIVPDVADALRLHDEGYSVLVGDFDAPDTYKAGRVEQAALVAATHSDTTNANISFTVREISSSVPIVATVNKSASIDILHLAGADEVLQLGDLLGRQMAERTLAPDGLAHVIGRFADLLIAEGRVASTGLAGKTLAEAALRSRLGVGVIGVWERGEFEIAGPNTLLEESSVLILAAGPDALAKYDACYATGTAGTDSAIIIGGGRVGRAAGRACAETGTPYKIVEQQSARVRDPQTYVLGDAAELEVLEAAGIRTAASLLITTHDDDMNVYLTIYARRLRPDLRIVSRANLDRNVSTLYRAGADDVLSYASAGAEAIWHRFRGADTLMVAEGLRVFTVPIPSKLAGVPIADSGIRRETGCNVVAVTRPDGTVNSNPGGSAVLEAGGKLILIGDAADEDRFVEWTSPGGHRRSLRSRLSLVSPVAHGR